MINPNPPARVQFPVMLQSWNLISFLHWPVPAESLQRRLPRGLEIQTFDGSAWIGLTPFLLEGLRLPFLPAIPWLSRFPETNLRTYVHGSHGPGVWFFALEADRLAAVLGARLSFGLPYHWSDMRVDRTGDQIEYFSSRGGRARAHIKVRVSEEIAKPDELAVFLTARFLLYAGRRGKLLSAAVEHAPWPLRKLQVLHLEQTLTESEHLETGAALPMALFSWGVQTRVAKLKAVN
jgi:uncharacterized protein YqjF (DUF2071 family)